MSKYIFITGGVVSGLGKGITAASLGKLFKSRGYTVEIVKFNPYFNIDSVNLCPKQYGEIFITDDGRSCDLVIGHYERILDESLTSKNDVTSGEIYRLIINKERENFYDGTTVQVVPHITDEIKRCILRVGEKADIVIVEVGGTVGDIEAQPYMEAIRQLKANLGKTNVAYIHVSLITYIDVSGEIKTKPTQHSVKELQNLGIQPDVIVCRSDYPLDVATKNKLALFCNVEKECIIESMIKPNIYEIPLMLESQQFCDVLIKHLKLQQKPCNLDELTQFCNKINQLQNSQSLPLIKIGILDKNADKLDAHMSLTHALLFSGIELNLNVLPVPISTDKFKEDDLNGLNGLIVANSVCNQSAKSKLLAIKYAQKNDLPLLMLGDSAFLGLESGQDKSIFVDLEKGKKTGAYQIELLKNTLCYNALGGITSQRFYTDIFIPKSYFDSLNLTLCGVCNDGSVACYEKQGHKFFVGVFFRPEFLARPHKPSKILSKFLAKVTE